MAIDWLTISAQVVNFLILVFILKRFLYRPILEMMNRRQQAIDDDIETAEQKNDQAQALCQQYETKLAELEKHRVQLLEQAKQAAESKRQALLEGVREDIETQRRQWQTSLDHEQLAGKQALKKTITEQVSAVSRRVLKDLADSELELEMMDQLIQRFEIHTADKEGLIQAISSNGDTLTINSTQAIAEAYRQKMITALQRLLKKDIHVDFATRAEMICGISLEAGGQRWEWSIDSYLNDLDSTVSELLTPTSGQAHHV